MKLKKFITFLGVLVLMATCSACSACSWFDGGESSSSSDDFSYNSTLDESTPDNSSTPDMPSAPNETFNTVGTLEYGLSLYHGHKYFSENAGGTLGLYFFGACKNDDVEKQYVYMPYVEGKNAMTFTFYARDAQHKGHDGAFKLGFNNAVYTYDGTTNRWCDETGAVANIQMKDLEGEDVDWSSLRYKRGWPHTVFTIYGVSTNVEIIYDFDKCNASAETIWETLYAHVYNIGWGVYATDCELDGHLWTPATCIEPKTCSVCGETEGEALGHNYGNLIEKVEATPNADGMEAHYYCDRCETYFDTNKVATTQEALVIVYNCATHGHRWVDATCTLPKTCSVCGETEGEANGHTYGNLIEKVEQTSESLGMEAHYYCICGTYFDVNKVETSIEQLLIGYVQIPPLEVGLLNGEEANGNWAVHDEMYLGAYSFAATQVGTKVVTYVAGYNTLTFKITSRWGDELFPKTFKLFIDGVYYEYKEVNGVSGWYNGKKLNMNIKMTEDNDGDFTWIKFEITKIAGESDVKIVSTPENGTERGGYGKVVSLMAKEFAWSCVPQSIHPEPDSEPEPGPGTDPDELLPLEVTLPFGGGWGVHDEIYRDAYSFGTVKESTKTVEYVAGYNTLTFKITSRWEDELFPRTFKLFVDGVYYEYSEVNGVAGWYNGESLNANIKTSEYNDGDFTWITFEITGIAGESDVQIVSIPENGTVQGGYGKVVTLIVKEMVWTVSEVEEPEECAHEWTEATCKTLKTCTKCGATEGDYAEHAYGNLIDKVPAEKGEDGMEAHYFCEVCDTYFDADKNETSAEDLVIEWGEPEEPEFPPVSVELAAGGNWAVHDEAYAGGWSFAATQEGTKTVEYVAGYNTLTFKITSRWEDELFPRTFKLFVDGVYYEYSEVNGVAGWYNGESLNANIKTSEYNDGDFTWITFEITGIAGESDVKIVSIPENGTVQGGYGKVVTLIVKEMVWSVAVAQ